MEKSYLIELVALARRSALAKAAPGIFLHRFTQHEVDEWKAEGMDPHGVRAGELWTTATTPDGRSAQRRVGKMSETDAELADKLARGEEWARPRRISLDGGSSWTDADAATDAIDEASARAGSGFPPADGAPRWTWKDVGQWADGRLWTRVRQELASSSPAARLKEYMRRTTSDLILGGAPPKPSQWPQFTKRLTANGVVMRLLDEMNALYDIANNTPYPSLVGRVRYAAENLRAFLTLLGSESGTFCMSCGNDGCELMWTGGFSKDEAAEIDAYEGLYRK